MPYITRDNQNIIQSLHNEKQIEGQEFLPNNDPQVMLFYRKGDAENENQTFLNQTDIELVRVLEDVVDLLTEKHVILFTELPTAAQNKLLQRKSVRQNLNDSFIDTEEDNIF